MQMSISLTNVEQELFDELVKIEYRSKGFILRDSVRVRSDVIGSTVQFRKMGEIIAVPTGFQNAVTIQDPGFTPHVANLTKYTAPTAVDTIQELTVNFDAKRELAIAVAMAIGRRSDQIVIDALNASGTTFDVPAGGANMSYSKLRNVVQYFEQNAVPIEDRFIAMSGNNLRALLASDQIISRFYTSNDAVVNGTLNYKELMGMNIRIIPDMVEGGLPLSGNIRTCFAWHRMALGMGIGQDLRTEINYVPLMTSYLVNGLFYAGAVAVDNRGIITVECDESVNP
jgi:hypothetical protein